MPTILSFLRRLAGRLSIVVMLAALFGRVRGAWRRRSMESASRRSAERSVLPSLSDEHADASRAPRRRVGLKSVPIERVVGTMRSPSQNTADFLPLPKLRGENWRARWQRITRAHDRLEMMPPVDLVQVGEDYYVADGHNRVAVARLAGAVEIDADVTQLILPGITKPGQATLQPGSMIGAGEMRRAGQGRHSRTVAQPIPEDTVSRRDLARGPEREEGE